MPESRSHLDPLAMLVLIVLCASWGVQQVAIKAVIVDVSPVLQAGIRSIGAGVLVWAWLAARRVPLFARDGTLKAGIAAGLLFAFEFVMIYWGLEFTQASRAVIFLYLTPFIVALGVHWFVPGESITRIQVIGLVCAFAGIFVAFAESLTFPTYREMIGDAMMVGAAVLWGSTTVLIKATRLAHIEPGKTLLYQLAVSAVVLPLGSWALGEPGIVALTPLAVGSLLYQAVWVAFITYLIWFWLLRAYPASQLASFTFLTPLFGVLAGGFLLNEPITPALVTALVLVGTGIYLVNRPPRVRA